MTKHVLFFSLCLLAVTSHAQTTLFTDDMEGYTTGQGIAEQTDDWDTWDGTPAFDAMISEDFSSSGSKSVKIQGTTTDIVLPLGPVNSGKYDVRWKMYIPAGSPGAYFNGLHQWANNSGIYQWAVDVFFTSAGIVNVTAGGVASVNVATVPVGQWFDAQITADMDADVGKIYLGGEMVIEWQWSLDNTTGAQGLNQFAAVNFYGANAGNGQGLYYVDDVEVIESTGVGVAEQAQAATPVWYPNPADEVVFLDLPTWSEGGRVMLLDLTGRVVYGAQVTRESMRLRVDAGALTSGIYLVKVVNGGKAFTGKLTVRR